jgi:hypothetical protein
MPAIDPECEGRVVLRGGGFNGVKVFSATKFDERSHLGEKVTAWMNENLRSGREIVEIVQTQSSDEAFHCLAITVFYREPAKS